MKKRLITLVLLSAVLLCGCSYRVFPGRAENAAPQSTPEPEPVAVAEPEPTSEPGLTEEEVRNRILVSYGEEWKQYTDKGTGELLLDYSCVSPEVSLPGLERQQKAIQSVLDERTKLFVKDRSSMEKAAKAQYASEDVQENFVPYALNRTVRVSRGDAAVLSFLYIDYSFAGGVHGYAAQSAVTFDTESGKELHFDELAAEPESLRSLCLDEIRAQAEARGEELFDGYEETLPTLLEDGSWRFTEKGLVFTANPYDIAPYASGVIEFSVSYKKLSGVLHERYQRPVKAVVQGGMNGGWPEERSFSAAPLAELSLAPLSPFVLWAENTVYNVRLCSVSYLDYNGSFAETEELLFASRMDDGEYWRIAADIPDTIPNLQLSWQLPDGTVQKYLISMSGMDGSLLLTDPNSLAMLQPGELQPENDVFSLAMDLNGRGDTEFLSVNCIDTVWNVTVSADGLDYTQPTVFARRPRCFVADVDGDGCFEILLSGKNRDGQETVYVWRFTDKLDKVPFTLDGETLDFLPCSVLGVDVDEAVLTGRVDILGKCSGTRPFSDGPDGTLAPAYGSKWDMSGNQNYITVSADLSIIGEDGSGGKLMAGTKLRLISYDGERAGFETDTGIRGQFPVKREADGRVLVNGKSAALLFDGIQ